MAVMTFTQDRSNIYNEINLSPSANGCDIDFTPSAGQNYQCVDDDPNINPPTGDDYNVWNNAVNAGQDFFAIPDVSSAHAGEIAWIRLRVAAMTPLGSSADLSFKVAISRDSYCTSKDYSAAAGLVNIYRDYENYWTQNPWTAADWTWSDLDKLQIGYWAQANSVPSFTTTMAIRPTGNDSVMHERQGAFANWACIDEETPNYNTDYVYNDNYLGSCDDWYNMSNHSTETGAITNVTEYMVVRNALGSSGDVRYHFSIITHGTTYDSPNYIMTSDSWDTVNYSWAVNPNTSSAWTWAEIDDLKAGFTSRPLAVNSAFVCTQMYIIVTYVAPGNELFNVTRAYLTVGYYESTASCYWPKAERIETVHGADINMLNFWDGTTEVYSLARNKKTTVMSGKIWDGFDTSRPMFTACEAIQCMREMAEKRAPVTISGSGSWLWDNEYRILSLKYRLRSKKPESYDWMLELEHTE